MIDFKNILGAFMLLILIGAPQIRCNLQEEFHDHSANCIHGQPCPEHGEIPPADHIGHNQVVAVPTEGSPWPLPQSITTGPDTFYLSDAVFRFSYAGTTTCPILDQAFVRYFNLIFYGQQQVKGNLKDGINISPRFRDSASAHMNQVQYSDSPALNDLVVAKTDCSEMYPSLESNENYTLTVAGGSAHLNAASIWGVLRGLETFSQLVYESNTGNLVVNSTTIKDFPRFAHRGFLIDTSRHFLPLKYIYQMIDGLAYNKMNVLHWHIVDYQAFPYESMVFPCMSVEDALAINKMNVFHWHIVDDQSFPYDSIRFPSLQTQGAFTPNHVYSQADVASVIAYARERGVRVMPEFDTPGHATSWGSIKDLLTPCYKEGKPDGTTGPVNPILNSTYDFLNQFFAEIHDVFPDNYVHVGGDEVSFNCWKSNPDITDFMKKMGYGTDYAKLEEYYMQKLLSLLGTLKVQSIVWQEVVDNGVKVSDDTVVQVWLPHWQDEMGKLTKKGHRVLLSSTWYLNRVENPYGKPWHMLYQIEPTKFNGTAEQKKLVMGGEACMWGEFVDGTNIIQRTWPRASTVAERLWSASTVIDIKAATPRLAEHRCRMVRRGLQAEPVTGPGFCKYEY